jgi:hypothetical protein
VSKKSAFVLRQEILSSEVKPNDIWKHYKGQYYLVKHVAIDCNTNELVIVYQNFTEQDMEGILFTRTHREWTEEVEPGIKRFTHSSISFTEEN